MEGSSGDPSRRRRLADLYGAAEPEEGELVPGAGYHSDADTEEYYNTHRDCSSDSDETVSDSVPPANYGGASTTSPAANGNNGSGRAFSAAAALPPVLACPFCGKEFRNHKAVCGHMKVHREEQGIGKGKRIKRIRNAPAVGTWGRAGKRGCSGSKGRAASPDAEPDQSNESMAIVVAEAEIVFNPMPLAFAPPSLPPVPTAAATPNPSVAPAASATPIPSPAASATVTNDSVESSSTAQPTHSDAMETVDAGASAADPPTEAAAPLHAAPPPPPPPAAGEQAPPVHEPHVAPQPGGGRQDPNGYTCKKCNMWFRTHQGLGGHMVGHKNRDIAAALQQDGAVPSHRSAKPAKAHVCRVCGAEFPGGLQLGGHMRKHWTGAPLNKKPRRLPPPGAADLTLALSVKADEASPAPAPAVATRVLLFGIDIGAGVKTPAAQEGTSATEAPASTGGEQ